MQNVYILHGLCDKTEYYSADYPSPSNNHWHPWLQKQLMMAGYNCQTPEAPQSYEASYDKWLSAIEHLPMDENTILVGHSAGCGFFLKWLSNNEVKIKKLIMVAPWLDPDKEDGDFLQCELNASLSKRVDEMHVFYSRDEHVKGVEGTVDIIMNQYKETNLHTFDNHGHFVLEAMETGAFPELLEIIIE